MEQARGGGGGDGFSLPEIPARQLPPLQQVPAKLIRGGHAIHTPTCGSPAPSALLQHWREVTDAAATATQPLPATESPAKCTDPELVLQDPGGLHPGLRAVRMRGQVTREWVVAMAQRYEARIAALEEELGLAVRGELQRAALQGALDTERARTDQYEKALRALQARVHAKSGEPDPTHGGMDAAERHRLEARMNRAVAEARAEQARQAASFEAIRAELHAQAEASAARADAAERRCLKAEKQLSGAQDVLAKTQRDLQERRAEFAQLENELKDELERERERRLKAEEVRRQAVQEAEAQAAQEIGDMRRQLREEQAAAAARAGDSQQVIAGLEAELADRERSLSEETQRRQDAEARAASSDQLRLSVIGFAEKVDQLLTQAGPATERGQQVRRGSLGALSPRLSSRRLSVGAAGRAEEAPSAPDTPAQQPPAPGGKSAGQGGRKSKAPPKAKGKGNQAAAVAQQEQPQLSLKDMVKAATTGNAGVTQVLDSVRFGVEILIQALASMNVAVNELTAELLSMQSELHTAQSIKKTLARDLDEVRAKADRERVQLEQQTHQAERRASELRHKLQELLKRGNDPARLKEVQALDDELREEMKQIETKLHVRPDCSGAFKQFLKRMHNGRVLAAARSEKKRSALMERRTKLLESALEAAGHADGTTTPNEVAEAPPAPPVTATPQGPVRMQLGFGGGGGGLDIAVTGGRAGALPPPAGRGAQPTSGGLGGMRKAAALSSIARTLAGRVGQGSGR